MLSITYIGALPSGTVKSVDGRESIAFVRGVEFEVSVALGKELIRHSPGDWRVSDASADVLQNEIIDAAKS